MSIGPILLTAGGTGGHVFPAKALADALLKRGHKVGFITDTRGTAFEEGRDDLPVYRIRAAAVAGRGLIGKAKSAIELMRGYFQSRSLITRLNPVALVGFGGYVSVPPVFAADARAVPIVLHEQNAVLGRANRLLAPKAKAIVTCFTEVFKVPAAAQSRLVLTGNPVREPIVELGKLAKEPAGDRLNLLVTGGSQGASVFAKLVPEAIALLASELRARLSISQQAREDDLPTVKQRYEELGVEADVQRFFTDMPARLGAASLMICRSGASTVAENQVAGIPSLLLPYPHATDDHQTANARAMEASGGARVLPESETTAESLAQLLEELLSDPQRLTDMASAARASATPDAVERLADLVEQTAGLGGVGAASTSDQHARRRAA